MATTHDDADLHANQTHSETVATKSSCLVNPSAVHTVTGKIKVFSTKLIKKPFFKSKSDLKFIFYVKLNS